MVMIFSTCQYMLRAADNQREKLLKWPLPLMGPQNCIGKPCEQSGSWEQFILKL